MYGAPPAEDTVLNCNECGQIIPTVSQTGTPRSKTQASNPCPSATKATKALHYRRRWTSNSWEIPGSCRCPSPRTPAFDDFQKFSATWTPQRLPHHRRRMWNHKTGARLQPKWKSNQLIRIKSKIFMPVGKHWSGSLIIPFSSHFPESFGSPLASRSEEWHVKDFETASSRCKIENKLSEPGSFLHYHHPDNVILYSSNFKYSNSSLNIPVSKHGSKSQVTWVSAVTTPFVCRRWPQRIRWTPWALWKASVHWSRKWAYSHYRTEHQRGKESQ